MIVREAFAHGDCGGVGIYGIGFVSYISAVEVDCLVANLVQGGDEGVECGDCGVTGEPDCFAVVGCSAAAVVLFLTLVDWEVLEYLFVI